MPVPHGSIESIKSTIRSIEDNSQTHVSDTLKQSIVQDVKNTKLSGEGCLGGNGPKAWGSK